MNGSTHIHGVKEIKVQRQHVKGDHPFYSLTFTAYSGRAYYEFVLISDTKLELPKEKADV